MQTLSISLLRQARRNRRMTLQQVAAYLGISESSIWRYENGKLPLTTERLFQLLQLYNCSVTDVVVEVAK